MRCKAGAGSSDGMDVGATGGLCDAGSPTRCVRGAAITASGRVGSAKRR